MIHRDLKSRNLLLTADWKVKVCDFGLARAQPDDSAELTAGVGTPEWTAPEIRLKQRYGPSADVFSFGTPTLERVKSVALIRNC